MANFTKKEKKSFFAGIKVGKKTRQKPQSNRASTKSTQSSRDEAMAGRYASHMARKYGVNASTAKKRALKDMRTNKNFRKVLYEQYDDIIGVESNVKAQGKS